MKGLGFQVGSSLCPQHPLVHTLRGPFSAVPTWVGREGPGAWQPGFAEEGRLLTKGLGDPASRARVPGGLASRQST